MDSSLGHHSDGLWSPKSSHGVPCVLGSSLRTFTYILQLTLSNSPMKQLLPLLTDEKSRGTEGQRLTQGHRQPGSKIYPFNSTARRQGPQSH